MEFIAVPKARPGDQVAVVSPSFAAPAVAPAVHEQAMERLAALTGLAAPQSPDRGRQMVRSCGARPS